MSGGTAVPARPADRARRCGPTRPGCVAKLFLPGEEAGAGRSPGARRGRRAGPGASTDEAPSDLRRDVGVASATGTTTCPTSSSATSTRSRTGIADPQALSPTRRLLIGAYFTQEYAIEAAALFNPSMVAHPDQAACRRERRGSS